MAQSNRGSFRFLVLEGLMVLFGVLAALFVDEWRENRALDGQTAAAQSRLLEEVRQNLEELDSMAQVVAERLDSLRALDGLLDGTVALGSLTGRFGGYRQPDLAQGAWQYFSTSDVASRAPPELVQEAFALYAGHRYFLGLTDEVSRLVFSELNVDPRRGRSAWFIAQAIMEQQLQWARYFVPLHEAFLERWGDAGDGPTPPSEDTLPPSKDTLPAADSLVASGSGP